MPFPDGLVTVEHVFSPTLTHLGGTVRLEVKVIPSTRVAHVASGVSLSSIVDEFTVGDAEDVRVQIPAVDQPGMVGPDGLPITFWSYRVEVTERVFRTPKGVQGTLAATEIATADYVRTLQPRSTDTAPVVVALLPVDGAEALPLGAVYMGPAPAPAGTQLWLDNTDPSNIIVKRASAA